MHFISFRPLSVAVCGLAIAAAASTSYGHFLWVKTVTVDGKTHGLLYFGESPADETYHFPDKLAETKLWSRAADGKRTEVVTKSIETDDRVGHIGPVTNDKAPALETSQQYGIYGNALLVYHAKHLNGMAADTINAAGASKGLKLEIVPHVKGKEVDLTVLWNGKPLKDTDISVPVETID